MRLRVLVLFGLLAIAASLLAQGGDPLSGTWSGNWGPNQYDRNDVTLQLKWDGKALTGNIAGGSNVSSPIALQKATFDPKTGAVHMEADASSRGRTVHYIVDGKVEKNEMTGTWNHDNRKGDFKLTKK